MGSWCCCKPVVVAAFRDGDLSTVVRRHIRQAGCGVDEEALDRRAWLTELPPVSAEALDRARRDAERHGLVLTERNRPAARRAA